MSHLSGEPIASCKGVNAVRPFSIYEPTGCNVPSEYVVQREGSTGKSNLQQVTAEQICSYVGDRSMLVDKDAEEIRKLILSAPSQEYEVNKILDKRGSMVSGDKEYWIKWKGYPDPTWEREALVNALDLITEFHIALRPYPPSTLTLTLAPLLILLWFIP